MTDLTTVSSAAGTRPVLLPANQFPHFYQGGRRIERLRGLPARTANMPEDWVASTTTRFGQASLGLSMLPDGRLLREVIEADPEAWLGPQHVAAFGSELNLLVKLLDAGQRLIVHAHPDRQFAQQHLHCAHGKTEAWLIVETESPDALVYLGFREDVSPELVRRWVDGQDVGALLGALNPIRVAAGDVFLVPAGLPHAIGSGVLIVELQEPTDFSIVLEWQGFDLDGPADGHLGLGYDVALQCLDYSGWTQTRLDALRGPADDGSPRARALPPAADPFFRAERVRADAELPASVAVLVALDGSGRLRFSSGDELALQRGETAIVPYAAGDCAVSGDLELIRCLPPPPA